MVGNLHYAKIEYLSLVNQTRCLKMCNKLNDQRHTINKHNERSTQCQRLLKTTCKTERVKRSFIATSNKFYNDTSTKYSMFDSVCIALLFSVMSAKTNSFQSQSRNLVLVGCLIGFNPQGPMKGIFVSSKDHVSPPTRISSHQGTRL